MCDQQTAQLKFWTRPPELLRQELHSSPSGLSQEEAELIHEKYGLNLLKARQERTPFTLLFNQLKSTIEFILIFTTRMSPFLQGDIRYLNRHTLQQKALRQCNDSIIAYRWYPCLAPSLLNTGKSTEANTTWLTNHRYDCRYYQFINYFNRIDEHWFYQRFYA